MNRVFDHADLVITPAAGGDAPKLSDVTDRGLVRSFVISNAMAWTSPWNVIGQPAASVPAGWSAHGLPLAVQLCARSGRRSHAPARRRPARAGPPVGATPPTRRPLDPLTALTERAVPAASIATGTVADRSGYEQPLVLPQLGQAWQEPARCMMSPQTWQSTTSRSLALAGSAGMARACAWASACISNITDGA